MKKIVKASAFILSATVVLSACSKNRVQPITPEDDHLSGTYSADLSYKKDSSSIPITKNNAVVVVTKSADKYNFHFPDSIPDISAVIMRSEGEGYSGTVTGYSGNISMSKNKIYISIAKNHEKWVATPKIDSVTGIYTATVSYSKNNPATAIVKTNASIAITKSGDKYDFHFPDNIPDIKTVTMNRTAEGYEGYVAGYTGAIKINSEGLQLSLIKGDEKWDAEK